MDQRKRMFFVLACLTGAMTSTASLLAWMAPAPPASSTAEGISNILGIARSLVTEDIPVRRSEWHSVEIVPEPAALPPDLILASTPDRGEYHFFIDDRGSLSRASSWRGQVPASEDSDAVRVRLARPATAGYMSKRQGDALSALLKALDEVVSPRNESLPVRFDPVFEPSQLRAASTVSVHAVLERVAG